MAVVSCGPGEHKMFAGIRSDKWSDRANFLSSDARTFLRDRFVAAHSDSLLHGQE